MIYIVSGGVKLLLTHSLSRVNISACIVSYSGTGTNLKVGGGHTEKVFVVFLHFLALQVQLVVLVSAFIAVSWSVSC